MPPFSTLFKEILSLPDLQKINPVDFLEAQLDDMIANEVDPFPDEYEDEDDKEEEFDEQNNLGDDVIDLI